MRRPLAVLILPLGLALCATGTASAAATLPPIRHVFIIVLENKAFGETFGPDSGAPYLARTLSKMGAQVPNYYGVTHESLGNYIAMVSGQGSNPQTQIDCQFYTAFVGTKIGAYGQALGTGCVYPASVKTIANQLNSSGLTWKGYMEDMGNAPGQPKTCRHPLLGSRDTTQSARVGDQYAARHNPFVYFDSILNTPMCARDDVALTQLPSDLRSVATTPNYSFITPNLCDDGHDLKCVDGRTGGLPAADRFLRLWVPRIMRSPAYKRDGMIAIVFDEAEDVLDYVKSHPKGVPPGGDASSCCNELQFPNTANNGGLNVGRGGGRTGAVLLSPFIEPGTVDKVAYNHFSLLRSVEDIFGLGHLGYAGVPGLRALGADAFTCYEPGVPRARHGRLPAGSEIKLAAIGRGAARRPMVELKLWHPGTVSVKVLRSGRRKARSLRSRHVGGGCQLVRIRLPYRHGRVLVTVRAFHGVERRTLSF